MTLSVGQVQALATKAINERVGDAVFKSNAYLERLRKKQKSWSGERMSFPVNYLDDASTTGSFYQGSEALDNTEYDPYTEMAFELIELQETLVIAKRDLARNQSKQGKIKLLEQRLKDVKKAMASRLTKGLMSDGTASGGDTKTLNGKQMPGLAAFMIASGTYGGLSSADVSANIAYISSNAGVNRALTLALHQKVLGGASEGNEKPTLAISQQGVFNELLALIAPYQRTTREDSLSGLGHGKNTLVYNGVDHIIDNLAPANTLSFINEEYVNLFTHPEFDMSTMEKDGLETADALLNRIFWKGGYVCEVLRYQGQIKDITVS
jgi:hypothetical protein